jgi:hypothetical protein
MNKVKCRRYSTQKRTNYGNRKKKSLKKEVEGNNDTLKVPRTSFIIRKSSMVDFMIYSFSMKLPQCYQTLIINMPIISAQSIILRSGHE